MPCCSIMQMPQRNKYIQISFSRFPLFCHSDVEPCTMLGNLLENALDACRRMIRIPQRTLPPRTIRLSAKRDRCFSFFCVENSYDGNRSLRQRAFSLTEAQWPTLRHRHLLHPRNRRTSRRQCVRLSDGASLPRRNYVADEVGSSKSPHTAYCFAQLKQGTCLIRLNNLPANICQTAPLTMRLRPGSTDLPSMIDEPMTITALSRGMISQSCISTFSILYAVDQSHPVRQTDAVRIRHDSRLSEYIAHDQICTLAPDARVFGAPENHPFGTFPLHHRGASAYSVLTDIPRLTFPSPHGRTSSSISSGSAAARASTSGNFS